MARAPVSRHHDLIADAYFWFAAAGMIGSIESGRPARIQGRGAASVTAPLETIFGATWPFST